MNIPPPPAGFEMMQAPAAAAPAASQIPPPPQGFVMDNAQAPQPQQLAQPHMTRDQYLGSLPWYERLPAEFVGNQTLGHAAEAVAGNQVSGQALKTVAQPIQGLMGLANPQAGQVAQQQINSAYGDSHGAGGFVGQQIGNVINLPYMLSGAGRALSAAAAAGNERIDVANRRDQGQQISGTEELARSAGMGALDWGANKAMNEFGGKLFGQLNPVAAPTVKSLLGAYAAKFGKDAVTNEVISHAMLGANNLIAGRPLTEGMGANSIASALVQSAGQLGLHEVGQAAEGRPTFLSEMRRRASGEGTANETNANVHAHPNVGQDGQEQNQQQPSQVVGGHTPDIRQESAPTETRIPASEYKMPPREPQAQDEFFKTYAKDKAGFTLPNSEEGDAFPKQVTGRTAPDENAAAHVQPRPNEAAEVQEPVAAAAENRVPQVRAADEGSHPAELADTNAIAQHYAANNGGDTQGGSLIGAMMGMKMAPGEKFVKAIVPSDKIDPMNLTEDSRDPNKIAAYQNLPADQRANLPPVYVNKDMVSPDGGHRVTAAQNLGEPVTAYVPESLIGQHGIKAASEVGGKTSVPTIGNTPEAAPQEVPQAQNQVKPFLKTMREKAGELVGSESGGATMAASKAFAERDVAPKVHELWENAKTSLGNVSRWIGSGLSWTLKDRDTANRISQALAEHTQNMAQVEEHLKPTREYMQNWTDAQKDHWADQVEASGTATDPKTQAAADLSRKMNEENIEEGKKYGLNTSKWEGDYLGRLATFPSEKTGAGNRTSLAGGENFLKGRKFDTYSDFANFVRQHGGKLTYDNPMDTLLAKQTEIRRSIMARKTMYGEENKGVLTWVPDGQKAPDGQQEKLTDKLAQQDRPIIAPKWMVGKLSKMEHFDAQEYMKSSEWARKTQTLRPGDDLPEGMTYTGQNQPGQYRANANVADQFNSLISPGLKRNIPVLHQLASMVKSSVNLALNLSGAHYIYNGYRSFSGAIGRSVSNVANKEWDLLGKNLWLSNPIAAMRYGAKGLEEYRNPGSHPELASQVKGAVEGGARPQMKSVLAPQYFEQARKEWDAGNPIGSLGRVVKGINHLIAVPLHEHFSPKIKFAAQMMHAAQHEARGLSGEDFQRQQSLATDLTDNLLGQVVRDRQFQNKIVTDAQDLILTAPKFFEGDLRELGAGVRDGALALRSLAQGKKVDITPAMYSLIGHAVAQTAMASLVQLGMTAYTGHTQAPSSLQDLLRPRTGRKDDQGRDERVYVPTPFGAIVGALSNPGAALKNRLAPVWRAAEGLASGQDEHHVKLEGLADRAKFVGRTLMPYSLQGAAEEQRPGRPESLDKKVGEMVGLHYAYTPKTDAEKAAYQVIYDKYAQTPMSAADKAKSNVKAKLASEFRGRASTAWSDTRAALKEGKISEGDVTSIRKRASEKPGLQGLLNESSLDAKDVMEKVWPKMSPDEMKANQWTVRRRIAQAKSLTVEQRRAYFTQIGSDVKAAVAK